MKLTQFFTQNLIIITAYLDQRSCGYLKVRKNNPDSTLYARLAVNHVLHAQISRVQTRKKGGSDLLACCVHFPMSRVPVDVVSVTLINKIKKSAVLSRQILEALRSDVYSSWKTRPLKLMNMYDMTMDLVWPL